MTRPERWAFRAFLLVAAACVAVGLVAGWAVLAPDDSVRVTGQARLLSPEVVGVGGTVSWQRAGFCTTGVATRTARWAEREAEPGRVRAAFELPAVEFYPDGPECVAPMTTTIILPNYVPAGVYRLRLVTSWDAPGLKGQRQTTTYSPRFTVAATP